MKTKTFFLLSFITGMLTTQVFAQFEVIPPDNKTGTGTVESWRIWDAYYAPVFSENGDLVDWLSGTVTFHNLDHFNKGVWI